MAQNRQSLSEQSQRRVNRILLIIGGVLLILFLLSLCQLSPKKENNAVPTTSGGTFIEEPWQQPERDPGEVVKFEPGNGRLVVSPERVSIDAVLGKQTETVIKLKAENNAILLISKILKENKDDLFSISGSCMESGKDRLAVNEECEIVLSWSVDKSQELTGAVEIQWREDYERDLRTKKILVPVKVTVSDSNPCVICQCEDKDAAVQKQATTLKGDPVQVEKGKVIIDDEPVEIPDSGIVIRNGTVEVLAEPKRVPLNLKNELMGRVADNLDVIDFDNNKVGRLLGDGTIVNGALEVIGSAIPMVPAIEENGTVIGRMKLDDATRTVVIEDAKGKVLGYPRIDGQILDPDGKPIAFLAPWGLVINFKGDVLGGIVPTVDNATKKYMLGVMNEKQQILGYMRPQGLAVSKKNELIGGVVPTGVAVGAGCNSFGVVTMNGQVFDDYNQHIGHVLLDKSVLDNQNNELGSVVRQGAVIDSKGKVVGFVNSAGKAINERGVIGCVNPDGSVFAKETFVGSIMPMGRVIRDECGQVGSVYPDGKVMSLDLQQLGHIQPDGNAVGNKNKTLGRVAPWGTAIAPDCQLLGLISLNGNVVSVEGERIGCITRDKNVQDSQGNLIGQVTPFGIMMDDKNQVIGRVSLDGHLLDTKGAVVGCVNASKNPTPIVANSTRGVVIDENGRPTGWSFVAGKTYDPSGVWMGDIYFNGWVIGDKHQLVGIVPFTGAVFSDRGEVVATYQQMSGLVTNALGDIIGRVLPSMTVINKNGTEILGRLIPEKTVFVDMAGQVLGSLQADGTLMHRGQIVSGKILANGTLVDENGQILGARVPVGPVLNSAGQFIGTATQNGDFLNDNSLKIGHILSNGLAISDEHKVLGMVFPSVSTAVTEDGWLGSVHPQVVGDSDHLAYQGQVNDAKGNVLGTISASGIVLGIDQSIKGSLVPIAPFITPQGRLMGWGNFKGGVNAPDGHSIGTVLPSGLSLNTTQQIQGMLVNPTTVVGVSGEYLGHTTTKGELLSEKGEILAVAGLSRFLYDAQGLLIGQLLPPGLAIDSAGKVIGWTRYDGQIENGTTLVGQVGLDGHIFNSNGQMIGQYVPLGEVAYSNKQKTVGLVGESGQIQDTNGVSVAQTETLPYAINDTGIIGRLVPHSAFTAPLNKGHAQGVVKADGTVYSLDNTHPDNVAMMNQLVSGPSGFIEGGILPLGSAFSSTLGLLGQAYPDGSVYNGQKLVASTSGLGLIYSLTGELLGGIFKPGLVIDKKGEIVATTGHNTGIYHQGQQIGNKMAFSSALSTTNLWLGNLLPSGNVVDDRGQDVGAVALDGAIINHENLFAGQVLPDGAGAGVPQKGVYNTMPYLGRIVAQGLPYGIFNREILGRTTIVGDVVDKNNMKLWRILDSGYVLGKDHPLEGIILPFISAVDREGNVIGTVSPDGKIVSYNGDIMGTVAMNSTVKGSKELQIIGRLVPEPLIVNDCKVVGQTAYDGRVINGQGAVVGRIRSDGWAVDAQGKEIGRFVEDGPIMSPTGEYLGRTLPDSTVVDVSGVDIACATNSGDVIDKNGNKIGHRVPRGLVFDNDGNPIGYVDSMGRIINNRGEQIGVILGDGNNTAVDMNGNVIGHAFDRNVELFFKGDKLDHALRDDGWVLDKTGKELFKVDPNGDIDLGGYKGDPNGVGICEDVGYLKDCILFDFDGKKIASLMPDGTLRDENDNLYAFVSPTGVITAPNGTSMCTLRGININLQQCGLAEGKGSGRSVVIGGKVYQVNEDGSVVDENNTQIGYTGDGGRIFGLDGNALDPNTVNGRKRPPQPEGIKVNPDDLDDIQRKLAQKRQSMRQGLGGKPLTMSAEMQARYKPKKDKDWSRLGVDKSISSWPVDMSRVILQGRAISAVLARSIDSRYSDSPALAIVDTNVYAEEGRNILIPAGSRLIGEFAGSSDGVGSVSKVDITWTRLIRPDGVAFSLESGSGDAMGRGGIAAFLDEQILQKYSGFLKTAALANSFLFAENKLLGTDETITAVEGSGNYTGSEGAVTRAQMRQNWKDAFDSIQDDMIERMQRIQPILYVPIGTRLTVLLRQDLWLRSAEDDEAEADEEFGAQSKSALTPDMPSWAEPRKKELKDKDVPAKDNTKTTKQSQKKKEKEILQTPLYDGTDHMPTTPLADQVVAPITPNQSENLF